MVKLIKVLPLLIMVMGCQSVQKVIDAIPPQLTNSIPPVVEQPVEQNSKDAIDPSLITTYGTMKKLHPSNAQITKELRSVVQNNTTIKSDHESLADWPTGIRKVTIQAEILCFWQVGPNQYMGGQIDSFRPGQTSKNLENLIHGRLDGKTPAKGQDIYWVLMDIHGKQRTQIIKQSNPYQL